MQWEKATEKPEVKFVKLYDALGNQKKAAVASLGHLFQGIKNGTSIFFSYFFSLCVSFWVQ